MAGLFGMCVENTVRITCVFNAFQCKFDKYKKKAVVN